MEYSLTGDELNEIGLLLDSEALFAAFPDVLVQADSILGEAADFIFLRVAGDLLIENVPAAQRTLATNTITGTADDIDAFIEGVLSERQQMFFRRAVLYRVAANLSILQTFVTSEGAVQVSRSIFVVTPEQRQAFFLAQSFLQVDLLKVCHRDDGTENGLFPAMQVEGVGSVVGG